MKGISMELKSAKEKTASVAAAALTAISLGLALALMAAGLAACGGFKTNPTDGYQGLKGVQPYAAAPNERPVVHTAQAFVVTVLDAGKNPLANDQILFESGKPATYFAQSSLAIAGAPVAHELRAEGLPAGVSMAPEAGAPAGLYRISGTPMARKCAPIDAPSAIAFSWALASGTDIKIVEIADRLGPSEHAIARPYRLQLSNLPIKLWIEQDELKKLSHGIEGQPVSFIAHAENVASDSFHRPTLVADSPLVGGLEPEAGRPSDDGSWQWRLTLDTSSQQWQAGERERSVPITLTLHNGCDKEESKLSVSAQIARSASAAQPAAARASAPGHK
jgi:hypothetical protein